MKTILTLFFCVLFASTYGQTNDFDDLLNSGKSEFKKEFTQQDFELAVTQLKKAIVLRPDHPEARYFLGYAYSRLNSQDAKGMLGMSLDLVEKASEQFETVNRLSQKYEGEVIALDPYSKLTAEWGSMGMSYWLRNMPDSAQWAFREGKKRGGFSDYILGINRKLLEACSEQAILLSSGDNFTIPLWYLQIVEGTRTDVSVIDISLLNTKWYPPFLSENKKASFDLPQEVLDTIEYCAWKDSTVTISDFSWTVKPTYGPYLLRGNRMFLSLLREENFQRDLYFTIGFQKNDQIGLDKYLMPLAIVDKLVLDQSNSITDSTYYQAVKETIELTKHLDKNSLDQLQLLDNFRGSLLIKAGEFLGKDQKSSAKQLLDLLKQHADSEELPYQNKRYKQYEESLYQQF